EIYDRFVRRSGWSHRMYAAWLAETLVTTFDRASKGPPELLED
ncbi:MAG: TetR/AcrR family transcriptional regulator, partial [Dermatophilaceae bacterium]|nr:TetR/AcrR family transcriptional regulator [Dermatophilaceae bacterium]